MEIEGDKVAIEIFKKQLEDMAKPKYFVCEICHEKTPIECEGREPNTCAMCMPIADNEF